MKDDFLLRRLMCIRTCPGRWLGRISLFGLDSFITGYLDALHALGQDESSLAWFKKFNSYVMLRCETEGTTGNAFTSILSTGYDDESGVARFFELLDDFMNNQGERLLPEVPVASEIQDRESRVFRLDRLKETDIVSAYLQEHCQKFFGVQKIQNSETLLLQWGKYDVLTCALVGKNVDISRLSAANTPEAEQISKLSVITEGNEVFYTSIIQKSNSEACPKLETCE